MLGLFIQSPRQSTLVARGVALKKDSPRRIASNISALVKMDRLVASVPKTTTPPCTDVITKA